MAITLLYFARIRETIGLSSEVVDLPARVRSVNDLILWLQSRSAHYDQAFADRAMIRAAVDQRMARFEDDIRSAAEIAFFPPVTGG